MDYFVCPICGKRYLACEDYYACLEQHNRQIQSAYKAAPKEAPKEVPKRESAFAQGFEQKALRQEGLKKILRDMNSAYTAVKEMYRLADKIRELSDALKVQEEVTEKTGCPMSFEDVLIQVYKEGFSLEAAYKTLDDSLETNNRLLYLVENR